MNKLYRLILSVLRKIYKQLFDLQLNQIPECDQNPESVAQKIYEALLSDKPCMIARLGANELAILSNYLSIKSESKNIIKYIKGEQSDWWWNKRIIRQMYVGAGFFPLEILKLEKFCELMLQDIPQVDILGSWLEREKVVKEELKFSNKVALELLNPYFSKEAWTRALAGKKILVVHPFSKSIENQYIKRILLFKNEILPEFSLKTIKAVQGIAGIKTDFVDWFEALEYMKSEIDKHDYDICLIGCGAYGFPLAAHVKRMGKKAVHLGGSLQLLFGIRGKRWEDDNYNPIYNYKQLMNDHWIRPNEEEKPKEANRVENACYW